MAKEDKKPIIKKVKKVVGGGHHGGAWKVAYADFVTAMMAFFLLLWILNSTTEEQRRGLSQYFGPPGKLFGAGGAGGVMGGTSIESEGSFKEARASSPVTTDNILSESGKDEGVDADTSDENAVAGNRENQAEFNQSRKDNQTQSPSDQTFPLTNQGQTQEQSLNREKTEKMIEKFETETFQEVKKQLEQALKLTPELQALAEHLIIDITPEGLRIQLVDRNRVSMFPNGSAELMPQAKKLIELVVKAIERLPNRVSITGHTDAKPYNNRDYTNWELSVDRANATRRYIEQQGIPDERLLYVVGKAAKEPLDATDPFSDVNRRISVVLHRSDPKASAQPPKTNETPEATR
ncbi:MAG: flagellar motor protein MotB [Holosporales bacterium]